MLATAGSETAGRTSLYSLNLSACPQLHCSAKSICGRSICLRELLYLYQTSLGDRADFLDRVIVLTVGDTLKFSRASERAAHVLYWQQEEKKLDVILSQLDRISISDADRAEQLAIKDFAHRVSDILSWVADTLMPRSGVSGQESLDAALALFQQRLAQKSAPGATVTKLAEKMRSANS